MHWKNNAFLTFPYLSHKCITKIQYKFIGCTYIYIIPRVKKKSLGESLAGTHAYNPIRDSRRDSCRDFLARKVSPTVSPKVSPRVSARLLARLLARLSARLLARLFGQKNLAKSLAESFGSDYMHDSGRDSLRDSFFLRGSLFQLYDHCFVHSPSTFFPFLFSSHFPFLSLTSRQKSRPWECDHSHSLLCCISFAREHRETAENLCRYSRPVKVVWARSVVSV